jgi:hypothetical protein
MNSTTKNDRNEGAQNEASQTLPPVEENLNNKRRARFDHSPAKLRRYLGALRYA